MGSNPTGPANLAQTLLSTKSTKKRRSSFILRAKMSLTSFRGGLVRVILPSRSIIQFGTRRQVPIVGTINGYHVQTTAFPTGDGRHFVFVNKKLRNVLDADVGDSVSLSLEARAPGPVQPPHELLVVLSKSKRAGAAWASLSPAAKKTASNWIAHARSSEVRAWRISNVIERAIRFYEHAGPFYPTDEERSHLGMPR